MSGFADQPIAEYLLGSTLSIISDTGVAKEGEDMSFVELVLDEIILLLLLRSLNGSYHILVDQIEIVNWDWRLGFVFFLSACWMDGVP